MNRRIDVKLADWDSEEERVTVTTASGTAVLYDLDDSDSADETYAAQYIDAALAEGPWLLRFAGTPGDFLGAGTKSAWATYRALTDVCVKFTLTAVEEVTA